MLSTPGVCVSEKFQRTTSCPCETVNFDWSLHLTKPVLNYNWLVHIFLVGTQEHDWSISTAHVAQLDLIPVIESDLRKLHPWGGELGLSGNQSETRSLGSYREVTEPVVSPLPSGLVYATHATSTLDTRPPYLAHATTQEVVREK